MIIFINFFFISIMPNLCMICNGEKATHGKKNGEKQYCKICSKGIEGVGNLCKASCQDDDCFSEPTYNFYGQNKPLFCSKHKKDGMEDIKHVKCIHTDENTPRCKSLPTYGKEGGKAQYCKVHSELYEGMVLIRKGLCHYVSEENIKCRQRAAWNTPGMETPKWCSKHKKDNDEYVIKFEKCKEESCETRPIYNYPGQDKRLYCKLHMKEGMVNVNDPTCLFLNCKIIASYGPAGTNQKLYCAKHYTDGMQDNRSKKCEFAGCKKEPNQNYPGQSIRRFCAEHAEADMLNIKSKKCKDCNEKEALYNYKYEKSRLYCGTCKKPNMVNLSHKICSNKIEVDGVIIYDCLTTAQRTKYDGYCLRCYMNLFPNSVIAKNYKSKQNAVSDYIRSQFPDIKMICDRVVQNGKSKRRPDILIQRDTYNIIIEIDEDQHDRYDDGSENIRSMELYEDLGNKQLVMIRFNPDSYYNKEKVKVKSCWIYNNERLVVIGNEQEWNKRLQLLKETLCYHLTNSPSKDIDNIFLYYDENQ